MENKYTTRCLIALISLNLACRVFNNANVSTRTVLKTLAEFLASMPSNCGKVVFLKVYGQSRVRTRLSKGDECNGAFAPHATTAAAVTNQISKQVDWKYV
uniref:Secreted protein n=1 Tax=Romanomermis culicivorax TaxID=13658 RepID=A0A915JYN0_ROMCU